MYQLEMECSFDSVHGQSYCSQFLVSHAVSRKLTEQKEQRYAYKRPGGKADQLPSGQIEHDLGFDFG